MTQIAVGLMVLCAEFLVGREIYRARRRRSANQDRRAERSGDGCCPACRNSRPRASDRRRSDR